MSTHSGTEGSVRDVGSVSFTNTESRAAQLDNAPDGYGPDPDLVVEVDIQITSVQRNTHVSAGTQRTMSGRKTGKSRKSDGSHQSSGVRTRGRPIKPHETEPFLSVDTLPPDKKPISTGTAGSASTTRPVLRKPSTNATLLASYHSPRLIGSPSIPPRNNLSRSGRRTPMSSVYVSPNTEPKKPNAQLKSPFKHDVNKPQMDLEPPRACTPSQDMKERTALATYHISRVLAQENLREAKRPSGKLLKGKLQPLYPVTVKGPSMTKCRGIVADTRFYGASPNRTLQRRKQLVNAISNVTEYLYDRPRTVESVHRTSVASSLDNLDDGDYGGQDQDNLEGRSPVTSPEPDEDYLFQMENRFAHVASCTPENKGSPMPVTEELVNIEAPSYSEEPIRTFEISSRSGEVTPGTMFVTEVHPQNQYDDVSERLQGLNLNMSSSKEAGSERHLKQGDLNNNSEVVRDARPRTAHTADHARNETEQVHTRPHTAGEITDRSKSPSKSVRFADDANKSKEMKQMKNAQIIKQQRNLISPINKTQNLAKSSDSGKIDILRLEAEKQSKVKKEKQSASSDTCKPVQINGYKEDDDDDDKDRDHFHGNNRSNNAYQRNNTGRSQQSNSSKRLSSTSGSTSGRKSGTAKEYRDNTADKLDTRRQPPILQVQSVLHGDQVHTTIGSVSPQRSRSPSPNRSQRSRSRSPLHQAKLKSLESIDFESNLSRQSLALVAIKDKHNIVEVAKNGRKHSLDSESEDSRNMPAVRRPKVGFYIEGEKRESLFWEDKKDDDILVGLRDDRRITFDEIDAELNALRDNIQEQIQDDTVPEDSASTCSGMSVEEYLQCYHELSHGHSEDLALTINRDSKSEKIEEDFSSLLDDYRTKCMEVSENCGEMSEVLASPHKESLEHSQRACTRTRPSSKERLWSRRSNSLERPTSGNRSLVSGRNDSSQKHIDGGWKLSRKMSDGAIFSDSGCGSTERLSEISQVDSGISDIPRLQIHGASYTDDPDTGRASVEGDFDGKTLLEIVCDELPEPENIQEKTLKTELEEEDAPLLEVVAKPKELSRPRSAKTTDPEPIAPFPPICFAINARPPQGFLYYFSYGTDMNLNRFRTYIKRDVDSGLWGLLFGFSLVFNKKGSDIEAGGFPNIEFNPFCSVEGCIYKITPQELELLDKCVGYPEHYTHVVFPVWMSNSDEPDKYGIAQYCVPAVTYIAQDKWISKDEKLSSDYSLSQCLKSSSLLTPAYREHLINMAASEQTVSA